MDETSVQIGRNKKIYVWRKADEKDRPHLLPKKARSGVTKIMMRGYITSKGRGILLPVNGSITSEKYYQVLQNGIMLMQILFLTKITLLATTHLNQEAGLMIAK